MFSCLSPVSIDMERNSTLTWAQLCLVEFGCLLTDGVFSHTAVGVSILVLHLQMERDVGGEIRTAGLVKSLLSFVPG